MTAADSLPPAPRPGGQLGRLGRLVRKELNEILRDRRTIITLVLMPVVLYPLLSIGFRQFALATYKPDEGPQYWLGFPSRDEFMLVSSRLGWREDAGAVRPTRPRVRPPEAGPVPVLRLHAPEPGEQARDPDYLPGLLRKSRLDLVVRVRNLEQVRTGRAGSLDLQLLYLEGSPRGQEVRDWMENQCALANVDILRYRLSFLESRLRGQRVPPRAEPLRTDYRVVKAPEKPKGHFLQSLVPLVLILMTITGAVYPAIDLTAGERERGTLEILVAAPVSRLGLLFAKYVTVFSVAVLTALVNLVTMTVTLVATGMGGQLFGPGGLSVVTILEVLGLLLLFAAFFSAVLLVVASFARSFKEAQAYLIPLMLVSLLPGMLAVRSGLTLTGLMPVVPLLNTILLARDLFREQAQLFPALVVVLSTLLYALAALALAARIFGAEGVLYSEQGAWSDLFRRPAEPRRSATIGAVMGCVAVLFPAAFLLQGLLHQAAGTDLALLLGFQVLLTVFLFLVVPLGWAALGRVRVKTGFGLRQGPWPGYLAALVLGLTLWPLALQLVLLLRQAGVSALGQEQIQKMLAELHQLPAVWLVLAFGLVPAVCEELFFRGYLFSALRSRCGPVATIAATAALFGLFHSFGTLDQAITSALLGVVLGWVRWRTGSVFPGMVLHACHNTLVMVLIPSYQEELSRLGLLNLKGARVPSQWLLVGLLGLLVAAGLLWLAGRPPVEEAPGKLASD